MGKKILCFILSITTCTAVFMGTVFKASANKNVYKNSCEALKAKKVRYLDTVFHDFKLDKNIEYSEAINYAGQKEKLLLDVYTPKDDTKKSRPVMIWVHGGALYTGSKDDQGWFQTIYSKSFAKKGYVTVNINYRLDPNVDSNWNKDMSNAMTDVVSSINWVKANYKKYGINRNKIILAGYSAGGEIVTNLVYGTYVNGWDRNGIVGVVDMSGNRLFWGDALKNTPPCTIIHGTLDDINPITASEELVKQLNQGNIYCEFNPIEGENHYYNKCSGSSAKIEDIIAEFLYNKVIK